MNQKLYITMAFVVFAFVLNYYLIHESFTTMEDAKIISTMGTKDLGKGGKENKVTTDSTVSTLTTKTTAPITSTLVTQEALNSQLSLQQKLMEAQTQKMIKDEMLLRRATDDTKKSKVFGVFGSDPKPLNKKKSLEQGSAYQSLTKDPKVVCPNIDTGKYIRRDQIPCWNCNLNQNK